MYVQFALFYWPYLLKQGSNQVLFDPGVLQEVVQDLHLALLGQEVEDCFARVTIVRGDELVGVLGQAVHVVVQLGVA